MRSTTGQVFTQRLYESASSIRRTQLEHSFVAALGEVAAMADRGISGLRVSDARIGRA